MIGKCWGIGRGIVKGVKGSIFSFLVSRVIMKEWEGISNERKYTHIF